MPPALEPFRILNHTGFKVVVEPMLQPGEWKYQPEIYGEVILMAPDVYKRLKQILDERK